MAEEHRVVQVSVDPGTRRNTVRYNTECGYFFYKKEQRGDVLRLECNRRKQGCPCKIYMRDGIFMQHGEHNHENEVEEQNRALAVRECEIIAGDPQFRRLVPKQIVEEARRRHPDVVIACNAAVEKRIQRAKRARQPPTPNSVDEMLASMENRPDYTRTINGEQFFHGSVYSDHEDENIRRTHRRRLQQETPKVKRAINQLYAYWTSYWLETIGPKRFSCYGRSNRTSNLAEAWHRWFNAKCIHAYLNPYDFDDELKDTEESKRRDYQAAARGLQVGRQTSAKQRSCDRRFAEDARQFAAGNISLRDFLERSRPVFQIRQHGDRDEGEQ
ncbi:hypothetical protein DAPPUDRAFT_332659 [Daphnia pulex]|uniref:FLYWCH-type domain-containing protein n=1 Tax=Daphnia pulex TaxID=6669 RepID=E9HQK4_DAPPU|nr:hypothetical protein DAPPUDRAFT_332659 [Daphnia pulex]|eukprot:EFX65988.1 hypothetical protein DAPPUDRAFT_332659 [Daphnia pulex]